MFHYEMCLIHYTVLVIQPVNTCEGHIVCPCDMGLVQSLMGMMEEVFAHPNIYCHSLCRL